MCQPKNCCDYYCNTVIMAISYRVGQKLQAHIFSYHIVATVQAKYETVATFANVI